MIAVVFHRCILELDADVPSQLRRRLILLAYAHCHAQSLSYAISEVLFSMLVVVAQTCVDEWGAI
jgi:hypothetical protein